MAPLPIPPLPTVPEAEPPRPLAQIDADLAKESAKLQALQIRQQLGTQALSIANGNSQSILSLFR